MCVKVVAYKLGAVSVGGSLLWVGEEMGHTIMSVFHQFFD